MCYIKYYYNTLNVTTLVTFVKPDAREIQQIIISSGVALLLKDALLILYIQSS